MTRVPVMLALAALVALSACGGDAATPDDDTLEIDRHAKIPADAVKGTPATDPTPPVLHSAEFLEPVPVAEISTAGAEDAPFVTADGSALYFFFAADVRQDASVQIRDPVNGIWVSRRANGVWQEPTLVQLQPRDELALNGCPFVAGDEMLFCTARAGYTGVVWFRAHYANGRWEDWQPAGLPAEYDIGELHIEGDELYYGSARAGGRGEQDIWMLTRSGGQWADPVNVAPVNTTADETRPYVTPGGGELWITRWYQGSPAIFRSKRVNGEWQPAELILSQFAGEPTLDPQGDVYFVHHFYDNGVMLEADIYVARRK